MIRVQLRRYCARGRRRHYWLVTIRWAPFLRLCGFKQPAPGGVGAVPRLWRRWVWQGIQGALREIPKLRKSVN